MHPCDEIDSYCHSVCREIRCRKARKQIFEEIRDYILDERDYYMERGFDEAEATERALSRTGDAVTFGEQLDKIHLPEPRYGLRPPLIFKTMLRAPVKTLLTFLLIAGASFALFSRVADYAVTNREMKKATSYYRGVAALDTGVVNVGVMTIVGPSYLPNSVKYNDPRNPSLEPPSPITAEQIAAFSSLSGVSAVDIRYMTGGVIENLELAARVDPYIAHYYYEDRFIIEGTISEIKTYDYHTNLHISDSKRLAGGLPSEDGDGVIIEIPKSQGDSGFALGNWGVAKLYKNPYEQEFIDGLNIGEKYLIIGRWAPRKHYVTSAERAEIGDERQWYYTDEGAELYLGDWDTLDYMDSLYPLAGEPENYIETDKFANVRELIEITNRDVKTFDMVYTSDLLSVPRFNEGEMVITEGRAITPADNGNVCVIHSALAKTNGLQIGDKITVDLCDKLLPQHLEMGATAVIPERYGEIVNTVELEIVGIYTDIDPKYERDAWMWLCYSPNTIFVPLRLLPVKVPAKHSIYPGEFSVIIDDPFMMKTFLEEAQPLARKMGLERLRFSDKGWLAVADSINMGNVMSLTTAAAFIGAAALAVLLAVYIYFAREKKNFAVMRALGTPQKRARNTLALPLAVISALAVPIGGVIGMIYAHNAVRTAVENLAATVASEYIPDTSLPVNIMLLCLLCEVFFLFAASALFMLKLTKTPVLELLQENVIRVKVKKGVAIMPDGEEIPLLKPFVLPALPKRGVYSAFRHVTRYVLRHMRRAKVKTALALSLAFLLTCACGVLAVLRLSYAELFDRTEVKGSASSFSSQAITDADSSELLKDLYYSGGYSVICNGETETGYHLTVTNDFDRYITEISGTEYDVWYGDGFGSSLFNRGDNASRLVVMGNALASMLGAAPGDKVSLLSRERVDIYRSIFDGEKVKSEINREQIEFTVAGIVISDDRRIAEGLFAPISKPVESISEAGEAFAVEFAEFYISDKEDPQTTIAFIDGLSKYERLYSGETSYYMDTAELDNIRRVRDMLTLLFPIALAAAVLIGLTAPLLIISQSSKEAAILRILGTTKLRARCMLAIEQISLCVFGLTIAALALVIYNAGLFTRSAETLMLCGGLYLLGCAGAAVFSASAVTRRKVLELLQVKE